MVVWLNAPRTILQGGRGRFFARSSTGLAGATQHYQESEGEDHNNGHHHNRDDSASRQVFVVLLVRGRIGGGKADAVAIHSDGLQRCRGLQLEEARGERVLFLKKVFQKNEQNLKEIVFVLSCF